MTTKIIVEDSIDGQAITYSFKIEKGELMNLKFTTDEKDRLDSANAGDMGVVALASTVVMLLKKIEQYKIDHGQIKVSDNSLDDLNKMYVDHVVMGLENRSIGKILDFLASYCGWGRIRKYVEQQIGARYIP